MAPWLFIVIAATVPAVGFVVITILVAFIIGPRLLSSEDPWLETVFILGLLWLAVWILTRPLNTLRRFQRAESLNRELL